ncbi:MAG: hypothetical protein IJ675_03820 [Pseudobutyrivibrio sp.]|nr:hypothetical protein [Pseudobutyrivibrio sp.]
MGYFEANYKPPVCNHKEGLSYRNIGYSIGITSDGVPFEAEAYTDLNFKPFDEQRQGNIISFRKK